MGLLWANAGFFSTVSNSWKYSTNSAGLNIENSAVGATLCELAPGNQCDLVDLACTRTSGEVQISRVSTDLNVELKTCA